MIKSDKILANAWNLLWQNVFPGNYFLVIFIHWNIQFFTYFAFMYYGTSMKLHY